MLIKNDLDQFLINIKIHKTKIQLLKFLRFMIIHSNLTVRIIKFIMDIFKILFIHLQKIKK